MRIVSFLLTIVALGAGSLCVAQAPAPYVELAPPAGAAPCPVTLTAEQGDSGTLLSAIERPNGIAQAIKLSLRNNTPQEIAAMDFDVRGLSPEGRVQPLLSGPASVVRHIHLARSIASQEEADSEVWIAHVSSVSEIVLTQVAFADGSMWSARAAAHCAAVPNPLMLIAGGER